MRHTRYGTCFKGFRASLRQIMERGCAYSVKQVPERSSAPVDVLANAMAGSSRKRGRQRHHPTPPRLVPEHQGRLPHLQADETSPPRCVLHQERSPTRRKESERGSLGEQECARCHWRADCYTHVYEYRPMEQAHKEIWPLRRERTSAPSRKVDIQVGMPSVAL